MWGIVREFELACRLQFRCSQHLREFFLRFARLAKRQRETAPRPKETATSGRYLLWKSFQRVQESHLGAASLIEIRGAIEEDGNMRLWYSLKPCNAW